LPSACPARIAALRGGEPTLLTVLRIIAISEQNARSIGRNMPLLHWFQLPAQTPWM
jgi:hypothetical protein